MADVKWIKITTDIFDDEKILLIESLPEADSIIVIWFKLLCLAGKVNNSGVFMLNEKIAYTDKMLATIFRRKETTVKLALETFEQFGMIQVVDNVITIPNWGKHQNLDQLESKKEYMRNYMKQHRQKQKNLIGINKYNEVGLPPNEWKSVLEEFDYKCAYCGADEDLEQDHIISVKKGGLYTVGNIVPACRRCNASKGEKEVFEWFKLQDFYDENRCKTLRKYLRKTASKANVSLLDKDIDIDKEIEEDKEGILCGSKEPQPTPKEKKNRYGEYNNVLLTASELAKLKEQYPDYQERIDRLSGYIASKGDKYKSHYATIRNWARKDAEEQKQQPQAKQQNKAAQELDSFYNMVADWAGGAT